MPRLRLFAEAGATSTPVRIAGFPESWSKDCLARPASGSRSTDATGIAGGVRLATANLTVSAGQTHVGRRCTGQRRPPRWTMLTPPRLGDALPQITIVGAMADPTTPVGAVRDVFVAAEL